MYDYLKEKIKEFNYMWDVVLHFFEKYGGTIISIALIVVLGYFITKIIISVLKRAFKKNSRLDPVCHKFILSIIRILLYCVFAIMALSKLNVDISSIVALFSVAGLAVSLAVKDSLSNVAGGFIILLTKPFSIGDFIEISDLSGTVEQVNILQTKLLTVDNKAVFIPNGELAAAKITNYSIEGKRRLDLTVPVSYNADIQQVKEVLLSVIDKEEVILKEYAPVVRVSEFGSSSVNFVVRVWATVEDYWELNWTLLEKFKIALDNAKIEIPYNKLDVNIINSK